MVADGYPTDLVPEEDPPERWVSGEVRLAAAARERLERRSTLWTYAIFEALTRNALQWRPTDRWREASASGVFGSMRVFPNVGSTVAVGLTWSPAGREWPRFGISLLVPGVQSQSDVLDAAFAWLPGADHLQFPVVLVPVVFDEHQGSHAPPNPRGGLATCWALDSGLQQGLLTAKHNVNGYPQGAALNLGSVRATLAAKAPGPVDAAFLALASHPIPASARPLTAQAFPAMSTAVDVLTARGAATDSIASVDWTFGVFNNANFPVKVYLRSPHSPGDSGALVLDASTREGVALYLGSLRVPTTSAAAKGPAGVLGFSQHLHQAEEILKLKLFH